MLWQRFLLGTLMLIPFGIALNPTPSVDLSIIRLAIPLVFLLWLFDSLKKRSLLVDRRPRFWLFLGFLLLSSFSYFWALDPSRSIKKIIFLIPLFLIYFPVFQLAMEGGLLRLAKYIVTGAFLAALAGFAQFSLQFIIGIDPTIKLMGKLILPVFQGENFAKLILEFPSWLVNVSGLTVMRAFGTFPDPHLFSLYLNMTLPLALWLYSKRKKPIFLAMAAMIMLSSMLSFSRAAYLSLAAAGVFLLFTSPLKKLAKQWPVLFTALFSGILLLAIVPNPLTSRFLASFNSSEGSNSGRIEMWRKGWQLTTDYPLTGVGLGNFSRALYTDSEPRNPVYAHNLLLDFASETGLIAAFFLLASLVCPWLSYLRNPSQTNQLIAASAIIFFTHSLFETPFYSVHVYPLFLAILALKQP